MYHRTNRISLKYRRKVVKKPHYPLVDAGEHHAHAEPHALVVVHHVGHELAGGGHGDALAVAQLVQAALLGEHAVPVHAVRCAARQRACTNEQGTAVIETSF